MVKSQFRRTLSFCLCGLIVTTIVGAADRTPEKILAEIKAIVIPEESKEPADTAKRQKLIDQKAKLILELYKASPTNPELVKLMPERWQSRPATSASNLTTKGEIEEILNKNKNPKLVAEAAYFKVTLAIKKAGSSPKVDEVMPTIDDFAKRFPKDERVGQLLFQLASNVSD